MPSPKQPELGERKKYQQRYRISVGPARGVAKLTDPSLIPDVCLVVGENVRVHDGIVVSRGGQQKATTDVMDSAVVGMIEVA